MGGNVFAGKTTCIPKSRIVPTLAFYLSHLAELYPNCKSVFNMNTFHLVGSAGKKEISGDIDIAAQMSDVIPDPKSQHYLSQWGLDLKDVTNQYHTFKSRARTASDEQLWHRAFMHLLGLDINSRSGTVFVETKKTQAYNLFTMCNQVTQEGIVLKDCVQVDWVLGDLGWLKFTYYSDEHATASNVKGLHRTQLLLSAFYTAGLSFNHTAGVKDPATGAILATSPAQALTLLNERLGTNLQLIDCVGYHQLHQQLAAMLTTVQYNKLIDTYLNILDSTRADIPDDLQGLWIAKRKQLNLSGKFLPDSSKLKEFVCQDVLEPQ